MVRSGGASAEGLLLRACKVRLVCLDLDGTLLGPDKRVSPADASAVRHAIDAGLRVAIASGRHPFNVCEQLDELGLPRDAVCLSGAYTMRDGREVSRHALGDGAISGIIDIVERSGCYLSLSGPDFNLVSGHIDRGPGGTTKAVGRYTVLPTYGALREEAERHAGLILKAAVHADDEATYEHVRGLLRSLPDVTVAQSDVLWSDVCPLGSSKAAGINDLAASFGIGMDEVAAVGDDENDVSSLGAVGLGIAVGNAVPAAREAADMVVADNQHGGVAEAIDFVLRARAHR